MKKIIAVMILIMMTMSLAACSGDKKDNGTDLVKVGEATINESQLTQYLELTAFIRNIDLTQLQGDSIKAVKSQMLDDMAAMECIRQYYSGDEDKVLPGTIESDYKSFLEETKSNETVKDFIEKNKISEDTLEKFYYDQYYRKAYYDEVQAGMTTLDLDAKNYYDSNKESFKADEVTASHILVEDEATAKDVLAKIKSGEKFEDLAKKVSVDPGSKDNGGSLGTFGRGKMVKEFEDAAFALNPGEISDVVKSEFGYHIIMVTDKNQGVKTYEEVKDTIIQNLVSSEAEQKINDLKSNYDIKYLTKEYPGATE